MRQGGAGDAEHGEHGDGDESECPEKPFGKRPLSSPRWGWAVPGQTAAADEDEEEAGENS